MHKLNEAEVRVIASLIEKEIATPEYYPMTINSLMNACNQKSNREPVVQYSDRLIEETLEALRHLHRQRQPEEPAPVLYDEHNVAKVEPLDEFLQQVPMEHERVAGVVGHLVALAESKQVRRHYPMAGCGKDRKHPPVEIAPCRLPVQTQKHLGRVARSLVEEVNAQPRIAIEVADEMRRKRITWKVCKVFLWGTQNDGHVVCLPLARPRAVKHPMGSTPLSAASMPLPRPNCRVPAICLLLHTHFEVD